MKSGNGKHGAHISGSVSQKCLLCSYFVTAEKYSSAIRLLWFNNFCSRYCLVCLKNTSGNGNINKSRSVYCLVCLDFLNGTGNGNKSGSVSTQEYMLAKCGWEWNRPNLDAK